MPEMIAFVVGIACFAWLLAMLGSARGRADNLSELNRRLTQELHDAWETIIELQRKDKTDA